MNEEKNVAEKKSKKMKQEKSLIKKTISFILSVTIILAALYAIFNYVPFIAKYDHYVIVTGSMEPVINSRDVVIIDSSVQIDEMEIGQIIAFNTDINNDGTEDVVVHYLYSYDQETGEIRTKPNISDNVDTWILTEDDILGTHVATIAKVGSFMMFASSTIGKIVLIVDVVVIYLLIELFSESDKDKKKSKELNRKEENTKE